MKYKHILLTLISLLIILLGTFLLLRTNKITDENGTILIPQNNFLLSIPDNWQVTMLEGEIINTEAMRTFKAMTFYTGFLEKNTVGTIVCGQYRSRDLILKDPRIIQVQEDVISQNNTEFAIAYTNIEETNEQGNNIGIFSFRPVDSLSNSLTACELTTDTVMVETLYSALTR